VSNAVAAVTRVAGAILRKPAAMLTRWVAVIVVVPCRVFRGHPTTDPGIR
jgi:hypothetical protein